MPLSRAQLVEKNERRLTEIAEELEGLATKQSQATTPEDQAALLKAKQELEAEKTAIDGACEVLRAQIEEARKQEEAQNLKHWEEEERPAFEAEFVAICDKIETRLVSTKGLYDKLQEAEERAKAQWAKRGRVGEPARTLSKRTFGEFLGVQNRLPVRSTRGYRKRIANLFAKYPQRGIRG